jgi:hypothetical protein
MAQSTPDFRIQELEATRARLAREHADLQAKIDTLTARIAASTSGTPKSAAIPFVAAFYRGDRSSIMSCVDTVQHQYGILPGLVRSRRREGLADERALQTIQTSRFACNREIIENGASRSRSRFLL